MKTKMFVLEKPCDRGFLLVLALKVMWMARKDS